MVFLRSKWKISSLFRRNWRIGASASKSAGRIPFRSNRFGEYSKYKLEIFLFGGQQANQAPSV
jgi:hypothetical protein